MSRLGLGIDGAKSRYSQAYLSAVCSQSGHTLQEGRQDEDCWAVDTTVDLTAAGVFVQLKCTSSPKITREGDFRVSLKKAWTEKWAAKRLPAYVLLVVVPPVQDEWIEHPDEHTVHRTRAYWQRFDPAEHTTSIILPKINRFQASTLGTWEAQLNDVFGGCGMNSEGPVRLADTNAWLAAHGWHQATEGSGGWMWVNQPLDRKIGIVRNFDDDVHAQGGLVRRLADAHDRDAWEIQRELQFWGVDVTYVRAANDIVIADTIPLTAGATMTESTRLMFRSAASAAVRLRPVIKGGYSRIGDEVADTVRMGHTIKGSYIIPVEVRVGDPEPSEEELSEEDGQGPITGFDTAAPEVESMERRMTRTFAQAMAAVHQEIVERETLPRGDALMRLVSQGVTAEFVDAVARVLDHTAVAKLDTTFAWAQSQTAPKDVQAKVEIPSEAHDKLRRTGTELRSGKLPRREVFTGPVVRVSHEPEDRTTGFAIRTVRGGRVCRIEALTTLPTAEVTKWMNDGTTVQLEGAVRRSSSGLFIPKATVAALVKLPDTRNG